ncbi:DUF1622 domain-containing protein [Candidatus Synechococcus calcipolaris G9]|uniref:DUF1622 domain-containing protein n=1 Tax=Candidatus Synechococcus calcipolaris G9 TaxID=1497997 RepID=A0ABT6EZ57_9SYNE|nr:DUF1622 domain-containing protein [Candidatus Synechococcus calcipolaris G9]
MLSSQWEDIARLVIIIAVRTTLNLLLERAIRSGQDMNTMIEDSQTQTNRSLKPDQTVSPEVAIGVDFS